MKRVMLVSVMLASAAAFAHGHGFGHSGGFRGGFYGGGGFHAARAPSWSPPVVRMPRPVFVAPRPSVYVTRPYYAPSVVVRPSDRPRYVTPYVTLPVGALSLTIGAQPYYLSSGSFYASTAGGYSIVEAPLGAWVQALPNDAYIQLINGITYATWQGCWFQWDVTRGGWLVSTAPY